ncbi:MAG: helicase [Massilia sp.]|nr:helicase [Massilia sp.]
MNFTLADLAGQFDPATYARGDSYASAGKVIRVRRVGDRLDSEVAGSRGHIYRQIIHLRSRRRGIELDGECSCPVYHNCKHVVAAALVHLKQSNAAGSDLPQHAEQWLQQLTSTLAPPAAPAATHRLIYVLMPDFDGEPPRLQLCKARLRKDGAIGAATIVNDTYTLLAKPPAYVQPDDEEPIRMVAALRAGSMYVGDISLTGSLGARLLLSLCGRHKLFGARSRGDLQRGVIVPILPGPPRGATLAWLADGAGAGAGVASVSLQWRFDDDAFDGLVLATEPPLYWGGQTVGQLQLPPPLDTLAIGALVRLVEQAPSLAPEQLTAMSRRLHDKGLERVLPLPRPLAIQRREDVAPVPHLLLNHAPQTLADYAQLRIIYDGVVAPADGEPIVRRMLADMVEHIARDSAAEQAAAAELAAIGFAPGLTGQLHLPSAGAWLAFARHHLPRLRQAGWQIELGDDYRYDFHEVDDWYAELNEEDEGGGNAWFALELGILVNGERHALLPLLVEMIHNAPDEFDEAALDALDDNDDLLLDLPDGTRAALPWRRIKPILATLADMYGERFGNGIRLPLMDAARLAELEQAAQLRWVGGERLRELGRKLQDFTGIAAAPLPAGLQAQLRPYQHAGLSWMQFLREYNFGGILADDMGLGKTVQTLSHILAEKEAGRLDRPALVVAPTSLMSNWQSEAARFTPGLKVVLLHGKERAAHFDKIDGADLVLTTYALLGRDEAALRAHRYHLLILDEAQYIKNSKAKATQTACLLEARHRLCLTGTPVQNHLGELWSQFHFLMPGLLGKEKMFNAEFRKPIEVFGDSEVNQVLTRRIKPFMLRRTKDKVATELPPKTEIHLPVEFGPAQRDLYETVRVAMDRKVRDAIDQRGLARSQIVILDALLKLRQVCCDPRLLKKVASNAGSAKLDTLMELLDTLFAEGRKVLVFSQFTSMLALIAEQLRERCVDFALLTGETVDRAGQVAAFQGGQVNIFLISLKAGGVGLNLTAADTVIHYDPWWNPASENQATDRAWRIGQTQPVFVYKLIAQGSVEEKIQALQMKKADLANAVLDPEQALAQGLGAEELRAIFS